MKILTIIPARGGSKGISRKNIKMLGGEPLIAYSIRVAMESKRIHTVMLSTEDREIACISAELGLPVPFMRPAELARDNTPTVDVVADVLETYRKQGVFFDAVMILEPTCPFRNVKEINECIEIFKRKDSDSLISVKKVPAQFNPHWVFEENGDSLLFKAMGGEALITRRQILPNAYARDGSIYITKSEVLLERHSLYGDSVAFRLNDNPMHVNIDSMSDWEEAERLLKANTMFKMSKVI